MLKTFRVHYAVLCQFSTANSHNQIPMSTSSSWFTFNHARMFRDLSILFCPAAIVKPQTEEKSDESLVVRSRHKILEFVVEPNGLQTVLSCTRICRHCQQKEAVKCWFGCMLNIIDKGKIGTLVNSFKSFYHLFTSILIDYVCSVCQK